MRGFPVQGEKCYLACGLGVQSYSLINLSIRGVIPKFKAAIFADPGWERQSTYDLIEQVSMDCASAGIEFHVVSNGNIRDDLTNPDTKMPALPFHINTTHRLTIDQMVEEFVDAERVNRLPSPETLDEMVNIEFQETYDTIEEAIRVESEKYRDYLCNLSDAELDQKALKVGSGMVRGRQCTGDYKITPMQKKIREIDPTISYKNPSQIALGISMDEFTRVKPSRVKMLQHCYPLIDMGWKRTDCLNWLEEQGLPIPEKSSCIGCPFHNDRDWRELSEEEFADVIEVESAMHAKGMPNKSEKSYVDNRPYLHPKLVSIARRPFDEEKDAQFQLFDNEECSGYCLD